jgi:hypothetical protein
MYKKISDQAKRYGAIILSVSIVVMFTVKNELIKFINRNDLTEYVQSHRSEVNVAVYLFVAIGTISFILAALYVILILSVRKNDT